MSDKQVPNPSTIAPSDSASTTGRKSKPGKAERAARRSAIGSVQGHQASMSKASVFAGGGATPKPQPGKFPVVFQTGAGEPSRDQTFAIDESVLAPTLSGFADRFTFSAKYAEFKAHAEITDDLFQRDIAVSALLRLAQQVVHSHVNMGLPQGDFAPVASTDVRVPASVSAYLGQFGEHSVPALGTRFLLSDYEDTVRSLIWSANSIRTGADVFPVLERSWLPVKQGDVHTKTIIAGRLELFLKDADLRVEPSVLEGAMLSGTIPDAWENIKDALGDNDPARDRFDFLFKSYTDAPQFVTAFTTPASTAVLRELRLRWAVPSAGHVDWTFNVKEMFTRLSDAWARKSATYAQFFELSSSQSTRTSATGSQSQMAIISTIDSVTVVKTHLALSAPEFSLVSCFPATAVYTGDLSRKVVVTTPLSVQQRATEFVQLDWR